jgi:HEAT repeat protein
MARFVETRYVRCYEENTSGQYRNLVLAVSARPHLLESDLRLKETTTTARVRETARVNSTRDTRQEAWLAYACCVFEDRNGGLVVALIADHVRTDGLENNGNMSAKRCLFDLVEKKVEYETSVRLGMLKAKSVRGLLVARSTDHDDIRNASLARECDYIELGTSVKSDTQKDIDILVERMSDEDSSVRRAATEALGLMGKEIVTPELIDAFLQRLKDEDDFVRRAAATAFCQIGEGAATGKVINALVNALKDKNSTVRWMAAEALGMMGKKVTTERVVDALTQMLADEDCYVRGQAIVALETMGEKAATRRTIDTLTEALGDEEYSVRGEAIVALGMIGERAVTEKVVNALTEALGDEDYQVREVATEVLNGMKNH